ncbi:hypothetical protein HCUR_01049 [Holospora curviuscula]|uniref:O-Antigen ligase n=2 Tax=Holospora curviuscula TaxID=1082868 RepID=A0A2S5R844_9PROT|nr:hypothetical protein HCUR_01049 [Holospora curviuscula]
MILQKNKLWGWKDCIGLSLGCLGWIAGLILPQHTCILTIFLLGMRFFLYPLSFEKVGGLFLFTLIIWVLDVIGRSAEIYWVGACIGVLLPVNRILHSKSLIMKVLWMGYGIVFLGYSDALAIQYKNPYWFLKTLLFPVSLSICIMQWRNIITSSLKVARHYSKLCSEIGFIWIFFLSYSVVWSINFLDQSPCSGLNVKHRVMYLSLITLPLIWYFMDIQCKKKAIGILGCVLFLSGYFQCRLGTIGIFSALSVRYLFLHYPKLTLWTLQGLWSVGANGVIFAFQWVLKLNMLRKIAFLNTSFYERLMFWHYFDKITPPIFWFGMGVGEFWRIIMKGISYKGMEKKMVNIIPSHTHCLFLDLKLCFGCIGIVMISVILIMMGVKMWHDRYHPLASVTLGICVYMFTIYLSFFGIISHLFVLGWGGIAWVVGKILYCSTWNNRSNLMRQNAMDKRQLIEKKI